MLNFSKSALWGATALIALCCVTPASAQSIAGPKPTTVPGTQTCDVQGQVVVTGIGSPSVANGLLGVNGLWTIFSVNEGTTPICSFPTAANAQVDCIANGRVVDPSNCTVADYVALQSRNLVPVSPGGVAPSDIRFANWVQPGFEVGGCNADWVAVQGAEPNACGDVVVPVTVSCQTTNSQSGTVPSNFLTCNPNTRPNDDVTLTNFRSCSFSMASDEFGEDSGTCGTITRSKSVYCERADENATRFDFSSPECTTLVSDFCANLPVGQVCDSQTNNVLTVVESREGPPCVGTNLGSDSASWFAGAFSAPSAACGESIATRDVFCQDVLGRRLDDSSCINAGPRPASSETTISFAGCIGPSYCEGGSINRDQRNSTGVDLGFRDGNPGPNRTIISDVPIVGGLGAFTRTFSDGTSLRCNNIAPIGTVGQPAIIQTICSIPFVEPTCVENHTFATSFNGSFGTTLNVTVSYVGGARAVTAPSGLNPLLLNGTTYTFGPNGWCSDISENGLGSRDCLIDAFNVGGAAPTPTPVPAPSGICEVNATSSQEITTLDEFKTQCLNSLGFSDSNLGDGVTINKVVQEINSNDAGNDTFIFCANEIGIQQQICSSDIAGSGGIAILTNATDPRCTGQINQCTSFPGSSSLPVTTAPTNASCIDECGEQRSNNETWCTAGSSSSLGLARRTSRCENGSVVFAPTGSGANCDIGQTVCR